MRICVYAIAKDEAAFVERFMAAVGPDVDVFVGDTGSRDNTVALLERYPNVTVFDCFIEPWRFDAARNAVLERILDPYDVYVSLDLDDVISSGWMQEFEQAPRANLYQYAYIWSHHPDGRPDAVYLCERIHSQGFRWVKRTHEVLQWIGAGEMKVARLEHLTINHYPDKSKPRSFNLQMLADEFAESPGDPRNAFYLGREYFFLQEYEKAAQVLLKYLSLPLAIWSSERSAAMRYVAKCCEGLDNAELAAMWYQKAAIESPEREPLIEMAEFFCRRGLYYFAFLAAKEACQIRRPPATPYLQSHYAWNGGPEHLMSFALWQLGDRSRSKKYALEAVVQDPMNRMFVENLLHYREVPHA